MNEKNQGHIRPEDDARTLKQIFLRRWPWIVPLIGLLLSSPWIYDHFAKEAELARTECTRQAADLDLENKLESKIWEQTVVIYKNMLDMIKNQNQNGGLNTWIEMYEERIKEAETFKEYYNSQPLYSHYDVIIDCESKKPYRVKKE